VKVETSFGDVVDRVTILRLKVARIRDAVRVALATHEHDALTTAWDTHGLPPMTALPEFTELERVNGALWHVEDELRAFEASRDFGAEFVAAARRVYHLNDERAAWKRQINERLGSAIVEVKSYGQRRTESE
jgi:hypothetical protein